MGYELCLLLQQVEEFFRGNWSGQIIATSHDLTLKGN